MNEAAALILLILLWLSNLVLYGQTLIEARGLNLVNLGIGIALLAWATQRTMRSRPFFSSSPLNAPLMVYFFAFPIVSISAVWIDGRIKDYLLVGQLMSWKTWVTHTAIFFLVYNNLESARGARRLLLLLTGAIGAFVAWTVLQDLPGGGERVGGLASQPNSTALFLSQFLPFAAAVLLSSRNRRALQIVAGLIAACTILALFLTQSRGGLAGAAVAVLVVIALLGRERMLHVRRLVLTGILGTAAIALTLPAEVLDSLSDRLTASTARSALERGEEILIYSRPVEAGLEGELNLLTGTRSEIWKCAINGWSHYPVFGTGFNTFRLEAWRYWDYPRSQAPHSIYFGTLVEGGIFWTAVLGWMIVRLLASARRAREVGRLVRDPLLLTLSIGLTGSIIATLTNGLVIDAFHNGPGRGFFWAYVAAILSWSTHREGEARRSSTVTAAAAPPGSGSSPLPASS